MKLYHFSKNTADSFVLDPKRLGGNAFTKKDLMVSDVPRVFFYTDLTKTEQQITSLKPNLYIVDVPDNEVYDLTTDPLGLKEQFRISPYTSAVDIRKLLEHISGYERIKGSLWKKNPGSFKGLYYVSGEFPMVVWFEPVEVTRVENPASLLPSGIQLQRETKEHEQDRVPLVGLLWGELGEMERREMRPSKLNTERRKEDEQEVEAGKDAYTTRIAKRLQEERDPFASMYEKIPGAENYSLAMRDVRLYKDDARKDYQSKLMRSVAKNVGSKDIHDPPASVKVGSEFGSSKKGPQRFSLKEWLEEELNEFNAAGGGGMVGYTSGLGASSGNQIEDPEKPEKKTEPKQPFDKK